MQRQPRSNSSTCGGLGLALSLAFSSTVSGQEYVLRLPIEQGTAIVSAASVVDEPLHGVLREVGLNTLSYEPDPDGDFWTLGSDSFEILSPHGGNERVQLISQSRRELGTLEELETPPDDEIDPAAQLEVSSHGRIVGGSGALVELDGSGAYAYLSLPAQPDGAIHGGIGGGDGGDAAGCAEIFEEAGAADRGPGMEGLYLPPGTSLSVECASPGDCTVSLLQGFDQLHAVAAFEVQMTYISPEEAAVRLVARESDSLSTHGEQVTEWYPIFTQAHNIRIDWWLAGTTHTDGGGVLRVDGRVVGELRGLANEELSVDEYRIGALDPTPGMPIVYRLDHMERYGGDFVDDVTLHHVSDFEEDWAPWSATTTAGDVRRSAAAALNGSFGLEAEVGTGSGWGSFLRDNSVAGTEAVTMRFSMSIDNLDLEPDLFALLLAGYHGSGGTDQAFRMVLSKIQGSALQHPLLNISVQDDTQTWTQVASTELGPGEHEVEVQWRKSDHPGTVNGCLRTWLEGNSQGELCGLDVDHATLEAILLGVMNVQDGTTGFLVLDSVDVLLPN